MRTAEPSGFAKYSNETGKSLYLPLSAASALAIASSAESLGVDEAMDSVSKEVLVSKADYHQQVDLLGLTKDDPKETTLLSLLKATLATALANGTPS